MLSLEGSLELSHTVEQVVIAKTDFENSGRYNIVDVTCCNVVNKGRLLRSLPLNATESLMFAAGLQGWI